MGGKYISDIGEVTKCVCVLFELRIFFVVSNEVAV